MPKKRRKLSKELENNIKHAIKRIEFITAVINDIDEEDIQGEYSAAFEPIKNSVVLLSAEYDTNGLTEISQKAYNDYLMYLNKFESEYEI